MTSIEPSNSARHNHHHHHHNQHHSHHHHHHQQQQQQQHRRQSGPAVSPRQGTPSRKHSERYQVVKIQDYVIYRKTIGAGSMGKVKLAECTTDVIKQKYAVKIMPKVDLAAIHASTAGSTDPKDTPEEREQRTIREMAIMRLLRHPNICQLKEYIAEGDKYYMFLEYVDGGQLLDYIIKHGKLREKQARKFARQIVSALDYCHRNSIVHRDLKIENILITQSEQLKIIDFGLSNVYSPTQQLNTFCGSLYFAAPELLRAKQYTGPEVDVWSFGVVLYVLVCGKVPFDDTNLPALHEKIKSGIVEDYPDHLGKDCLDLLSKIFVVDPSRRITLSGIQAHPWMNKGYEEPIRNYLPHRQPLEHIDMDIVKGMGGFGLGTQEEIAEKLQRIIQSTAYQTAAFKIDQNYQKKANDDQTMANRPRWRRTLSTRRKTVMQDDFRSLPAMYDPLVSIYYLVKERRESDERKKQLLNAEPSPVALSRSASTQVVSRRQRGSSSSPSSGSPTTLSRRKTYDTAKKLPRLPSFSDQTKTAATATAIAATPAAGNEEPPSTPIPTASRSERVRSTSTLIRKKSLQAVKKLGIKLSGSVQGDLSHSRTSDDEAHTIGITRKPSNSSVPLSSSSSSTATNEVIAKKVNSDSTGSVATTNTTPRKSNWLKLEMNNQSTTHKQPYPHQSSNATSRSGWRRLSISRNSPRSSMDQPSTQQQHDPTLIKSTNNFMKRSTSSATHHHQQKPPTSPKQATFAMKTSKSELIQSYGKPTKAASSPKSFFHFSRGHLIRIAPSQMMTSLVHALQQLGIDIVAKEQFKFTCSCAYRVWTKQFIDGTVGKYEIPHHEDLVFSVMVYEARWAGGKMGIKVKDCNENQQGSLYRKLLLKNIHHAIINSIAACQ